jgi:hypothetical protein
MKKSTVIASIVLILIISALSYHYGKSSAEDAVVLTRSVDTVEVIRVDTFKSAYIVPKTVVKWRNKDTVYTVDTFMIEVAKDTAEYTTPAFTAETDVSLPPRDFKVLFTFPEKKFDIVSKPYYDSIHYKHIFIKDVVTVDKTTPIYVTCLWTAAGVVVGYLANEYISSKSSQININTK